VNVNAAVRLALAEGADATEDILEAPHHAALAAAWAAERDRGYTAGWAEAFQKDLTFAKSDQCHLFRDLFGNPFRPITLAPTCRTPDALALAQVAYDQPILPGGTRPSNRPGRRPGRGRLYRPGHPGPLSVGREPRPGVLGSGSRVGERVILETPCLPISREKRP
jgi:hypothetical protein